MTMDIDLQLLLRNTPQSMDDILDAVSPSIYSSLKQAIELGRWVDGTRLSGAQLENAMQLMILYEARHLPEQERTGRSLKSECKTNNDDTQTILIMNTENGVSQ